MGRNAVWYMPNGKAYNFTGSVKTPYDSGLEGYCASRGLLEFVIRRRTAAISNIHFEYGTAVAEMICRDANVVGVRCVDSRSIEADLVVDATGRAHRARRWLAAIGFSSPEETEIGLDTAYSTANFRRHASRAFVGRLRYARVFCCCQLRFFEIRKEHREGAIENV